MNSTAHGWPTQELYHRAAIHIESFTLISVFAAMPINPENHLARPGTRYCGRNKTEKEFPNQQERISPLVCM